MVSSSQMLGMLAMLAASTASVATRAAVQRAATGPRLEIECNSNYPGRDIAADLVHYSRDYTSIEFLNCDLTTLDFGFLAEFPALDALYVEGGSLEEFHGMPTLPVLTWAQIAVPNFRTFWGPGLTPSLGCLILEMISDDAAIDNILTSALFYKESIWLLYLSRSGATRIPPMAIEFPDLNIFDYNFNNQTRRLTAGTFPSTFRPGAIFVDDCNITEIEPGTFEGKFVWTWPTIYRNFFNFSYPFFLSIEQGISSVAYFTYGVLHWKVWAKAFSDPYSVPWPLVEMVNSI